MVDTPLTVACVLWEGDFRKRRYNADWVAKLQRAVERRLPAHRFVCLSNVDVPCERIPLISQLPGWWAKLELFRATNGLTGKVLYLDLDTLPVDDLTPLVEVDVTTFMPPSYKFHGGVPAGGKGIVDAYQSSCFCFHAGVLDFLWDDFSLKYMKHFRGDQDWIGFRQPDLNLYPAGWFRKLRDCQDGPPKGVKLVLCMPWKNDEAARKFQWVESLWR